MSWLDAVQRLGHSMFIAYIELKIKGSWLPSTKQYAGGAIRYEALKANSELCQVHLIEPDGLRRRLGFVDGATISIHQNILSYDPKLVNEITVDEKEQSGKGKTRDTLH